jgi:hypothetical protein
MEVLTTEADNQVIVKLPVTTIFLPTGKINWRQFSLETAKIICHTYYYSSSLIGSIKARF